MECDLSDSDEEAHNTTELESVSESMGDLFTVYKSEGGPDTPIVLKPVVNGVTLKMELDTGASVSLISGSVWRESFPESELVDSDVLLKTYTGEKLRVLGQMQATVVYNGQMRSLPLLVMAGNGPSLCGRNWLTEIQLNWKLIKHVHQGYEPLLDKYSDIFRNELGTLKGIQVKLVVPDDAPAKFFKPHPVPYAIREAIE